MTILLLLIPLSLMLVGIAAWAFAWAVRRGQFDDLDTPALAILADDHPSTATVQECESANENENECDGDSGGDSAGDADAD
jgi:cbb3-type cytochrome oxidase maturation protein